MTIVSIEIIKNGYLLKIPLNKSHTVKFYETLDEMITELVEYFEALRTSETQETEG